MVRAAENVRNFRLGNATCNAKCVCWDYQSMELDASTSYMTQDLQDQKDEMAAATSFFANDPHCFQYCSDEFGRICGFIVIEFPKSDHEISFEASNPEGSKRTADLFYLPPVKLLFTLPMNYPSQSAPHYGLTAQWMPLETKKTILERLEKLWEDYCGMPILLAWAEVVKDAVCEAFMTSATCIDLDSVVKGSFGSNEKHAEGDSTTLPTAMSGDQLLQRIIKYAEHAAVVEYEKQWFACNVCFEERMGKDCASFSPCSHIFCYECISSYYREQLQSSSVQPLKCLMTQCENEASPHVLRRALGQDEYEKYEQLLFEKLYSLSHGITTCPIPSCGATVFLPCDDSYGAGRSSNLATCGVCNHSFCTSCRKAYHALEPCDTRFALIPETSSLTPAEWCKKILEEYHSASDVEKKAMVKYMAMKEYFDQAIDYCLDESIKRCPNCNTLIERIAGCDRMTCSRCFRNFCWCCGGHIHY